LGKKEWVVFPKHIYSQNILTKILDFIATGRKQTVIYCQKADWSVSTAKKLTAM